MITKKRFFLFLLAFFSFFTVLLPSFAQSPTESPTPSEAVKQKQIEDLKERLATKVAELRTLQRRAIGGKVKSQTVSTMTIETSTKDIKIELTDSIKVIQYLKGVRTKLTTDSVDNGDIVTVFGEYDTTLDVLRAKVILIDNTPPLVRLTGIVKEKDEDEFTLILTTHENISYILDVEKNTKTNEWSREGGITKSGFSKIVSGNTIHIVGTAVPKKDKQISADRILDLGAVGPQTTPTATTQPEATVSTTPKPTTKSTPSPAQ